MQECTPRRIAHRAGLRTVSDCVPCRTAYRVGLRTLGNYGKSFTAEYPRR